jgi:hypothetical protein
MSRRVRSIAVIGVILVLAFVGVLGALGFLVSPFLVLSEEPRMVSEATSPDGTWSVEVLAKPRLTGGYDIVIVDGDGHGKKAPGGIAIGLTRDLTAAQASHAVTFVDNNTAKVGSRTHERPASFR